MQKVKAKAKKKNVETGLLMGQNTNVFSQLSATILQNKASNTEEEARFLENTQIVQYHDPQVSRLITLLRKKAEVTKVKAASQLREVVAKMSVQQIEQFASTFAQLYLEIVMNEPSKAILEEFMAMVEELLQKHKKAIISQISTLYPPLLLTHKPNKLAPLLFAGTEEQMPKKIIVLLLKKEVVKKFIVMVRMILDSEAIQKIAQPQMQRNCQAITKLLRDLIRIFDKSDKLSEQEPQFCKLMVQVCDSFGENCIAEYFKLGGRAKASILELYSSIVAIAARRPKWGIVWHPYAKAVGEAFLDKDPIVQQALWRGAIHLWLESLLELEKRQEKELDNGRLLDVFLPKCEDKLLQALGIGGFALYKQLSRFCQIFPSTMISTEESHKQLVNKLTFFRRLLNGLLGQQDENEARMECYASLIQLLLGRVRGITLPGEEKKAKQVQSLAAKFQKEAFQNLQDRYYNEPPTSKNSFSYYIPQHFSALLGSFQPTFDFKFHPELTYSLYQGLSLSPYANKIIHSIFEYSQKSQALTLKYLQVFPKRKIEVDMSESNPEVQNAAKIFLLASEVPKQNQAWMRVDWDIRKQFIAFDPRITLRDLDAEEQEEQQHLYSLYFRPTHRAVPSRYDCPELDSFRFAYFKECLLNSESSHYVRYLLPFMNDILLPRNNAFSDELIQIFAQKCKMASEGKWAVGAHEVLVVRVLSQLLIETLVREKGFNKFNEQNVERCLLTMCEFVRLLIVYKMDNEAEDLLRKLQGLLVLEDARLLIFNSSTQALQRAWALLLKGKIEGADKVRKNRIKKCLDLTHRLLSFNVPNAQIKLPEKLAVQFLGEENNWKEAVIRSEPWHILHAILGSVFEEGLDKVVCFLLGNPEKNNLQIGLLLALDVLLPLQALPDIRRHFIQLKGILERQICKLSLKSLEALLSSLIRRAMIEKVVQLSEGVRRLIVQLLLEREEDSPALLEVLEKSIVVQPFSQFIRSSQQLHHALIYNTIASAVPLKRINQAESICAELTSDLLAAEGLNYFMILSTTCLFWNKGVGSAELLEQDGALLKQVVASALANQKQGDSTLSSNFASYSLFSLINTAIGLGGWASVEKFEQDINSLFWQEKKRGELQGLALSVKMKYASRAVLAVAGPTLSKFIQHLPEIIKTQLDYYSEVLRTMENDDEQTYHESVVTLFVESAEFLLRATSFITKEQMPEEATLLNLVQCPFPALKKAAFVLLKTIYEGNMVVRNLPGEFKTGLKMELKGEQLDGELCRQALGYFYTWQLLILRREATQRQPESEQEMPISLQDLIQSEGLSELLIKNCFFIIEDTLEYLKHEAEFSLSPEELLDHELEKDFLEEGQAQGRMFRLAVHTLFVFICNFPLFLRDCMDRFKKYRAVCERLLRNVVSEAIFRQEVLRIQMLQSEWKKGGNFDIYVISNNREIYAQYTHDVIRIGLRLVMRPTYPLTPIAIEFGEGLKIQQGSRWGLMLQSQLHNKNSSIIKGILLWKQNVDRKLAGVQQCAICFDIVNSHGQLPKKACKTCRKKFHGNCIMKWFSKSNKSECPLCKSQFL